MTAEQSRARRDELTLSHMHLVRAIATNVQRSLSAHTELDDLIHAGMIGLFDAATKFEEGKEIPFAVYAKHRIRGAILDSLRQIDWASRDARRQYKQVQEVTRELTAKLQRTPTQQEVAEAMGLDERRWNALMADFRSIGLANYRQTERAGSEEAPAKEVPASRSCCPDSVFARTEVREKLGRAMGTLPKRYQEVVKLYYENDMSMKEIGHLLGVNESRVSQIHKAALSKMHVFLGGSGISSAAALC